MGEVVSISTERGDVFKKSDVLPYETHCRLNLLHASSVFSSNFRGGAVSYLGDGRKKQRRS